MCIINDEILSMMEGEEPAKKPAQKASQEKPEQAENDEEVLKHINTKYRI